MSGDPGEPRSDRPALVTEGRALIVTSCYPPRPGGSSTVMYNLLSRFSPDSYLVATAENNRPNAHAFALEDNVLRVLRQPRVRGPLRRRAIARQRARLVPTLRSVIGRHDISVVVGVYPDLDFLEAGLDAASAAGVPFVAYLHDAPIEVEATGANAGRAIDLQARVLASSAHVFVMSEGMRGLFRDTYGAETAALEHTFPELHDPPVVDPTTVEVRGQAFWGGQVHGTNTQGYLRFVDACASLGVPLVTTATACSPDPDRSYDHVESVSHPTRDAYRSALAAQGALVVAIDWPDESPMEAGEVLTVFPTKVIEYLAAGRPIVAHCPPDSFLCRFLSEAGVGTVVTERSVDRLADALREAVAVRELSEAQQAAARAALDRFDPDRVGGRFAATLQRVAAEGQTAAGSATPRSSAR